MLQSGPNLLEIKAAKPGDERLTDVAESTLPAVRTDALKGVHAIDACPSIPTHAADTVVNI